MMLPDMYMISQIDFMVTGLLAFCHFLNGIRKSLSGNIELGSEKYTFPYYRNVYFLLPNPIPTLVYIYLI